MIETERLILTSWTLEEVGLSKSTVSNILKRHKEQVSTVQDTPKENGQLDSGQNEIEDEPTLL